MLLYGASEQHVGVDGWMGDGLLPLNCYDFSPLETWGQFGAFEK